MELKLESTEEDDNFKYDDTTQADSELKFAKRELLDKLFLLLEEYQNQKIGAGAKIKKLHSDMYVAIAAFIFIWLVDSFFTFLLKQPYGSLLAATWEMWVACITIYIAMWKSAMNMVKKIAEYHIHNESGFLKNHKLKHGIFTLRDEERFCENKEKETQALICEVRALTIEDSYHSYYELQYVDKRADTQVFGIFDKYGILWYILMGIIFLIVYVIF